MTLDWLNIVIFIGDDTVLIYSSTTCNKQRFKSLKSLTVIVGGSY